MLVGETLMARPDIGTAVDELLGTENRKPKTENRTTPTAT